MWKHIWDSSSMVRLTIQQSSCFAKQPQVQEVAPFVGNPTSSFWGAMIWGYSSWLWNCRRYPNPMQLIHESPTTLETWPSGTRIWTIYFWGHAFVNTNWWPIGGCKPCCLKCCYITSDLAKTTPRALCAGSSMIWHVHQLFMKELLGCYASCWL